MSVFFFAFSSAVASIICLNNIKYAGRSTVGETSEWEREKKKRKKKKFKFKFLSSFFSFFSFFLTPEFLTVWSVSTIVVQKSDRTAWIATYRRPIGHPRILLSCEQLAFSSIRSWKQGFRLGSGLYILWSKITFSIDHCPNTDMFTPCMSLNHLETDVLIRLI